MNHSQDLFGFLEALVCTAIQNCDAKTVRYAILKIDDFLDTFTNMGKFKSVLLNAVKKIDGKKPRKSKG